MFFRKIVLTYRLVDPPSETRNKFFSCNITNYYNSVISNRFKLLTICVMYIVL